MLKPKHTAQTLIQLRGEFVKGFRKNEPYMVLAQGFTVFTTHTESQNPSICNTCMDRNILRLLQWRFVLKLL